MSYRSVEVPRQNMPRRGLGVVSALRLTAEVVGSEADDSRPDDEKDPFAVMLM